MKLFKKYWKNTGIIYKLIIDEIINNEEGKLVISNSFSASPENKSGFFIKKNNPGKAIIEQNKINPQKKIKFVFLKYIMNINGNKKT